MSGDTCRKHWDFYWQLCLDGWISPVVLINPILRVFSANLSFTFPGAFVYTDNVYASAQTVPSDACTERFALDIPRMPRTTDYQLYYFFPSPPHPVLDHRFVRPFDFYRFRNIFTRYALMFFRITARVSNRYKTIITACRRTVSVSTTVYAFLSFDFSRGESVWWALGSERESTLSVRVLPLSARTILFEWIYDKPNGAWRFSKRETRPTDSRTRIN